MSYELRKSDDGDPIECDICHCVVPLDTFEVWVFGGGETKKRDSYQCEFCAGTHSSLQPVDETGHRGMAILFHEIRSLRAALERMAREKEDS